MIGFNAVGMVLNALRGDDADRQRVADCFGLLSQHPELVTRRRDLRIALTRKPWRLWHRFKHFMIEWNRLEPHRGAKILLDLPPWSFLLGIVFWRFVG